MSVDILSFRDKTFNETAAYIIDVSYPRLYGHLSSMDKCLEYLQKEYDVVVLEGAIQNIYQSFDQFYRLEKLVLFPRLIKLEQEGRMPENDAPFQKLNQDFHTMLKYIDLAIDQVGNTFVNDDNEFCIHHLTQELEYFKDLLSKVQEVKESFYEIKFHEVR